MFIMLTVEQIVEIKQKLKTEMLRRGLNGNNTINFGSIEKYGKDNYDFEIEPSKDSQIIKEHGEKTINLLYRIEDQENIEYVQDNTHLPTEEELNKLSTYIDSIATESMTGNSSSCRGACTGLCFGSCIGTCNGCTGKCDTGCQGCSGTCGTGCATGSRY